MLVIIILISDRDLTQSGAAVLSLGCITPGYYRYNIDL